MGQHAPSSVGALSLDAFEDLDNMKSDDTNYKTSYPSSSPSEILLGNAIDMTMSEDSHGHTFVYMVNTTGDIPPTESQSVPRGRRRDDSPTNRSSPLSDIVNNVRREVGEMWRQRAALRTSSAPPRPRNDRPSGDVVMEDALANDESASQSYGVIRRPNFVRNGGRSEEQVRNTEESLLQSAAGLRSYENAAVDPNVLESQLQAIRLVRARAEMPIPQGQPFAFMPPARQVVRTPSSLSEVDPYAYSAHFTPSTHGAGDARIVPPVFDTTASQRTHGRPGGMRPPAPMTQDQLLQSPAGRVDYLSLIHI